MLKALLIRRRRTRRSSTRRTASTIESPIMARVSTGSTVLAGVFRAAIWKEWWVTLPGSGTWGIRWGRGGSVGLIRWGRGLQSGPIRDSVHGRFVQHPMPTQQTPMTSVCERLRFRGTHLLPTAVRSQACWHYSRLSCDHSQAVLLVTFPPLLFL